VVPTRPAAATVPPTFRKSRREMSDVLMSPQAQKLDES
jgi:hypothetical protein